MQYRREVDGLRALAVLPVLFFHAGWTAFQGGYVGVDVFFVISGYLITGLIRSAQAQGRFSLASFYERRARRLLPALYVVLLACLPCAWWWMNASDFIHFSQSLAAVPLFSTGTLYMFTAFYFDASSELKPLLHTWSLGVEEQFYLLFPLLLVMLARGGPRAVAWSVASLCVGSMALAWWATGPYPTFSYYAMPTRAWELLLGALVALHAHRLAACSLPWRQALSALSLVALAACTLGYRGDLRFPGPMALGPTLATAGLLAFAQADTLTGRMLSHRWLVGVGLISYSTYLWHQPLFAFARLIAPERLGQWAMLGLIALTLVLGWASWRWIEAPARRPDWGSRRAVLGASLLASGAFVVLGLSGHNHWLLTRWEHLHPELHNRPTPTHAVALRSCRHLLPAETRYGDCQVSGEGSRTVVIWGDSHAKALRVGEPAWPDTRVLFITHSGCPPLPGLRRVDANDGAHVCDDFDTLPAYLRTIIALRPDRVIMASRWNLYLKGWYVEGRARPDAFWVSDGQDDLARTSVDYRQAMFARGLQSAVNTLARHTRVTVLTQPVDHAQRPFRAIEADDMTVAWPEVAAWHAPESALFQQLELPQGADVFDTKRVFCAGDLCRTRLDGHLLYQDDNHLSPRGATEVLRALARADVPHLGALRAEP